MIRMKGRPQLALGGRREREEDRRREGGRVGRERGR